MQHHPVRMPLSYVLRGYEDNPYERRGPRERGLAACTVASTDGSMAQAPALPTGFELPLEPRLPRIGSVDAVALEERAGSLAKRSIKSDAKVFALELAIRTTDLTTLEGSDTPGKVAALCSKAIRPDPSDPAIPSLRRDLRLPEPRADRARAPRGHRREASPPSRPASRPASTRRTSRSPTSAARSSSAPTRSTW